MIKIAICFHNNLPCWVIRPTGFELLRLLLFAFMLRLLLTLSRESPDGCSPFIQNRYCTTASLFVAYWMSKLNFMALCRNERTCSPAFPRVRGGGKQKK